MSLCLPPASAVNHPPCSRTLNFVSFATCRTHLDRPSDMFLLGEGNRCVRLCVRESGSLTATAVVASCCVKKRGAITTQLFGLVCAICAPYVQGTSTLLVRPLLLCLLRERGVTLLWFSVSWLLLPGGFVRLDGCSTHTTWADRCQSIDEAYITEAFSVLMRE